MNIFGTADRRRCALSAKSFNEYRNFDKNQKPHFIMYTTSLIQISIYFLIDLMGYPQMEALFIFYSLTSSRSPALKILSTIGIISLTGLLMMLLMSTKSFVPSAYAMKSIIVLIDTADVLMLKFG